MDIRDGELPGLKLIQPKVFRDNRGFFLESYNRERFRENGIDADFMQDNHAYSRGAGVLRGLHYQAPPAAQTKLVWVTRGAVLDVVVDLRKGSPAYGEWAKIVLSAENFTRLLVPPGFAHAYLTLSDETEFIYKVDALYSPENEGGLLWNDPDLGIDWAVNDPILSDKDKALPRLADLDSPFTYED